MDIFIPVESLQHVWRQYERLCSVSELDPLSEDAFDAWTRLVSEECTCDTVPPWEVALIRDIQRACCMKN